MPTSIHCPNETMNTHFLAVACFGISLIRGCLLFVADFSIWCCYFVSVDLDFQSRLMVDVSWSYLLTPHGKISMRMHIPLDAAYTCSKC